MLLYNKLLGIIQARMIFSRLPGKVLMPILGKPMLGLQFRKRLLEDTVYNTKQRKYPYV
ncbi:cytidylyltransferase domain-containing protein [Methylomusa anaerophila]|uniref:cytidylyltransferase domain-containing protein n=1 Tax=Methylomusa anaerophila TaxID=1930071 RepID=UPI000F830442